jgi:hypothetical protein
MMGAKINWASIKATVMKPKVWTPPPNSPKRRAKIGKIIPTPVISIATVAASSRIIRFARRGFACAIKLGLAMDLRESSPWASIE